MLSTVALPKQSFTQELPFSSQRKEHIDYRVGLVVWQWVGLT